jgi:hypothetical protein
MSPRHRRNRFVHFWDTTSRDLNGLSRTICGTAAVASKKDVAPVSRSQFRSNVFRSHLFSSKWSSGFAAAVYALALPTTAAIPALAGQNESKPPHSRDAAKAPENAKPAPPKAVVVITGTLDLGKITIADYGDVEPNNH